jgi:hypothetical protein
MLSDVMFNKLTQTKNQPYIELQKLVLHNYHPTLSEPRAHTQTHIQVYKELQNLVFRQLLTYLLEAESSYKHKVNHP